ncbi:MAG: M20/M25/M40 family metallo-hydrolase [Clostridiales Family XIII bacterium]|jgi:arginine utilization protein RocB|nr:M20/M25/M40 family metallo-hydrolase [Clostridiales Family XIII bacterium]
MDFGKYGEGPALLKKWVAFPSMNGSPGERAFAEMLRETLMELPYFQKHPENLIFQEMHDGWNRANVLALVRGEKDNNPNTVILHGHFDTVGIEDYGTIIGDAFNADALPEKIRALTTDPYVLADIESGEWMFGRGVGDMKAGVVVNYLIMKAWSEHPGDLSGNILFMANPVEENEHTGVMKSLEVIKKLRDEDGLVFVSALNTDAVSPLYPGDGAKYAYLGAGGKILPCFFVSGKPTHVGDYYSGVSASQVVAEIIRGFEGNIDFVEQYDGESLAPPTALKVKDLKPTYNVQTATAAFCYFNFFLMGSGIDVLLGRFKDVAAAAFETVYERQRKDFDLFAATSKYRKFEQPDLTYNVYTYAELLKIATEKVPGVQASIDAIVGEAKKENLDLRETCLKVVEAVYTLSDIKTPTAVVFIAPPYCPTNSLTGGDAQDVKVREIIREVYAAQAAAEQDDYKVLNYFPALSDSSYLKMDDSAASVQALKGNLPDMAGIYPVPVDLIHELNIPAVTTGVYAKDAHKFTERVHIPYTFGVLPVSMEKCIEKLLELTL